MTDRVKRVTFVTLTTDLNHPGLLKFKKSVEAIGYPLHIIHQIIKPGQGVFGTQMPLVYNWCKSEKDFTHMIYCDAWDSYILGTHEEMLGKIEAVRELKWFGSSEKGCFPHPQLAVEYPEAPYDWKYVNGGGWLAEIDFFAKMVEDNPINGKNDQLWLAEVYLKNRKAGLPVDLDYNCEIFQTIGFESPDDFCYDKTRIVNNKTGSTPMIFHGNGRTDMSKVWAYNV